jgi:hypothetical protein
MVMLIVIISVGLLVFTYIFFEALFSLAWLWGGFTNCRFT